MNRRSGPWIARILFTVSLVVALLAPTAASTAAASTGTATTGTASTDAPTTTLVVDEPNPFLPEERDLTVCVGTLERPGCGSEARGGWHQNLVAIAMVGGLLIVFGRIAWGIRRNQKRASTGTTG